MIPMKAFDPLEPALILPDVNPDLKKETVKNELSLS